MLYPEGRSLAAQLHKGLLQRKWGKLFRSLHRSLFHSLQPDFAIRYLNLSTRQYVRLFSGHKLGVEELYMQPESDHRFASAGRDKRILLWDLRTPQPTQQLNEVQNPLVAFDPSGRVIATCRTAKCIELYDVRMLDANPCQRFRYQVDSPATWTQLQFSPDGKALLVATDYSCCFSVDAYNGGILQAYTGWRNCRHLPLKTCYTPDSQFILAGADKGCVHVWHSASGRTIEVLKSNSVLPIRCLQFNPEKIMFVTCNVRTCFWQIAEMSEREEAEDEQKSAERKERLLRHEKEVEWLMAEEQRIKGEKEQREKNQGKQQVKEEQRVKLERQEKKRKCEAKRKKKREQVGKLRNRYDEEDVQETQLQVEQKQHQVEKEQPGVQEQQERKEMLPRKRLRSTVNIPTIDLTCIEDSSSSDPDEVLEVASNGNRWVRGTMVRRRVVSIMPSPIKFPQPRRWQLWRQRRSPFEEGELPNDG